MTVACLHYSAGEARKARDMVKAVYRGAYWENIESGDPFSQPAAFMGRYDSYAANPLFDLVIAIDGDTPVGQAWGWALSPGMSGLWVWAAGDELDEQRTDGIGRCRGFDAVERAAQPVDGVLPDAGGTGRLHRGSRALFACRGVR